MKVVFTAAALADLEDIVAYTKQNFPRSTVSLQRCIRDVISRIEMWRTAVEKLLNGQTFMSPL